MPRETYMTRPPAPVFAPYDQPHERSHSFRFLATPHHGFGGYVITQDARRKRNIVTGRAYIGDAPVTAATARKYGAAVIIRVKRK